MKKLSKSAPEQEMVHYLMIQTSLPKLSPEVKVKIVEEVIEPALAFLSPEELEYYLGKAFDCYLRNQESVSEAKEDMIMAFGVLFQVLSSLSARYLGE
jgi:hypothetical protein